MKVDNDKFLKLFIACRIADQNYVFDENMLFNFINNCKENNKHNEITKNLDQNIKNSIDDLKNNKILYNSEDNLTEISMNIKITSLINEDFTYWDNIAEFSNDYTFYEQTKFKNMERKIYVKKRYQN